MGSRQGSQRSNSQSGGAEGNKLSFIFKKDGIEKSLECGGRDKKLGLHLHFGLKDGSFDL